MRASMLVHSEREQALLAGRAHAITSPEGVTIMVVRAPVMTRLIALGIDLFLVTLLAAAFGLLVWALSLSTGSRGWSGALGLVGLFVLRNLYFPLAEVTMRGQTPGKRLMGLRVIDARGGQLRGEALFVRNITRELELLTPLVVLIVPDLLWPDVPWPLQWMAAAWLVIVALFPLLNRDRVRLGDLLAGTLVVREPRAHLMHDVGVARTTQFRFSLDQLDMYGIYELQVLEEVLRGAPNASSAQAIAGRITAKIGFDDERWRDDSLAFLREFYVALRQRLERRMQLGDRQEHKKEGRLGAEH